MSSEDETPNEEHKSPVFQFQSQSMADISSARKASMHQIDDREKKEMMKSIRESMSSPEIMKGKTTEDDPFSIRGVGDHDNSC